MDSPAHLLLNPFERFVLSPRVSGWVYRYANRRPLPIPHLVSDRLEIAVQVSGSWTLSVWPEEDRCFDSGSVFLIAPATRHTYAFQARDGVGLQVGFEVDMRQLVRSRPLCTSDATRWRALAARALVAPRDERLASDVEAEAQRACDEDASTWARARQEIVSHVESALFLDHLAEATRMHPKALSRLFLAHAGVAPIRFRTELRLRRAITLLWSRPDLSVGAIAETVGFDDARGLHRRMRETFGLTPAQLGRRR